jgi:hypothetical protein
MLEFCNKYSLCLHTEGYIAANLLALKINCLIN